jgi:hypothetical protein
VILHYIGCRPEGVPEGASVQWEVELLGYEKAKEWEGLNFKEIMAEVDAIKAAVLQMPHLPAFKR